MAVHVLLMYGNEMGTQVVKSVFDKLKYQLVVMLMVAMAMEGEPRDIECKLHLINVIWNACPKVHFQLW